MTLKSMTPAQHAESIIKQYPGCSLDVALEVLRRVHRLKLSEAHGRLSSEGVPRHASAEEIIAAVCAHYGVSVEALKSSRRTSRYARARHMAWAILRDKHGLSYTEIGARFDRDSTTISHGCKRAMQSSEDWLAVNSRLNTSQDVDVAEAAE